MLNLLLISLFASFFLAALTPLFEFIEEFIGGRAVEAIASLSLSTFGTWLVNIHGIKLFIVYTVSGAFLGASLYTVVKRITYHKTTVYQVK